HDDAKQGLGDDGTKKGFHPCQDRLKNLVRHLKPHERNFVSDYRSKVSSASARMSSRICLASDSMSSTTSRNFTTAALNSVTASSTLSREASAVISPLTAR